MIADIFHVQFPRKYGISAGMELATPGSAVGLATNCDMGPSKPRVLK